MIPRKIHDKILYPWATGRKMQMEERKGCSKEKALALAQKVSLLYGFLLERPTEMPDTRNHWKEKMATKDFMSTLLALFLSATKIRNGQEYD